MRWTRRRFLAAGAAAAGVAAAASGWWVVHSRRRSARLIKDLIRDAKRTVEPAPLTPQPRSWRENGITVCWLGHATVLIDFFGLRILTDPVFSQRVGVEVGGATMGPKRFIAPALSFDQLPPIDVVLLSHAHYDHLDLPSLGRFRYTPFAVTARATRDLLVGTRLEAATELGWGETTTCRGPRGELRIEAFEVKHWGRRWPSSRSRGYNGYVLRREGKALLFGGDTALTPRFAALRSGGPFEMAIMPIGAYNPWIRNHCTPEQAVEMATRAGARLVVPVHHRTFKLSDEPMTEPLERLQAALRHEPERLAVSQVGQSVTV